MAPSPNDIGYDVFISYSHQDHAWVYEQLLAHLEEARLRVCIDTRDFALGVPSLLNMEHAVDNSLHVLIVLTPAWVASEWTEFESLLAGTSDPAGRRRKIIPLMLKLCEPPARIAMLTWADFRDAQQHETQFKRLINQLRTMTAVVPTKTDVPSASSELSKQDIKLVANTALSEPMDPENLSLQTDGGTGIGGNVDTEGGDVVGRDKTVQGDEVRRDKIVNNYYYQPPSSQLDNPPVAMPAKQPSSASKLTHRSIELPYGTVSPTSAFYMDREADRECQDYFNPGKSVTVYAQAPRQMGKSSLMQRIAYLTKQTDKFEVAYIDCEKFTTEQLHNLDDFLIEVCYMVSEALDIPEAIEKYWASARRASLVKCSNYLSKHIVPNINKPLILAMDEVERVLDTPFRNDFFGMLRTWHNDRAHDVNMAKVSLFLSSSTEPQLFIDNPNQSPFNVAQPIALRDFTLKEIHELNQRHGDPLTQVQLTELTELLGGHPFLTRLALYMVATQKYDFITLQRTASDEEGPFAIHLDDLWRKVARTAEPRQALAQICRQQTYPTDQIYYRLKGAGLVKRVGDNVVMRNQLYARYFSGRLHV